MDRTEVSKVKETQCQVCGFVLKLETISDFELWAFHRWSWKDFELHILACQVCKYLEGPELLEKYQGRIKSGADLRYH